MLDFRSGSVIVQNILNGDAPSISAASYGSLGIEDRPARRMRNMNGRAGFPQFVSWIALAQLRWRG